MSKNMVDLNSLIVCAVCHSDLQLPRLRSEGFVCCSECQTRYSFNQELYDMTPRPLTEQVSASKWSTWQKLQENGLVSYTAAPEFNLSVGARKDALAFKSFCQMSGLVLDVGCGPQRHPSYLPEAGEVVGIDPLRGQQPRGFAFVQGIGEYLPFRGKTFDCVLYATSLDHVVDPRRSLAEAVRCLKPGGTVNLWLDAQAADHLQSDSSRFGQYRMLARKGFRSLSQHGWISKLGLRRTLSYVGSVARMEVPEGALDYFHFEHLTSDAVAGMLQDLNMAIARRQQFEDNLFLSATK